jgi:hypothetical protein
VPVALSAFVSPQIFDKKMLVSFARVMQTVRRGDGGADQAD